MSSVQLVVETIILHLKEGVNLEDVPFGNGASNSPAVQAFIQLTNTVKAQQGFICQYWGHEVEDEHIFVWSIFYTRFTSNANAAFAAPVTEVAFFTVPTSAREEAKPMIEESSMDGHPVFTVGKSSGGACGWEFETKNPGDAVPDGESIALCGVFGYASVDDHYNWRATPEHAHSVEEGGQSPLSKLGMRDDLRLPGGNIFVPDSSMFHVKFRRGK